MAQPFLGQIQAFGFGFAPRNWAFCNGQILSISQNTALFALLGTTYGGNGTSTYALPNLQSRVPIHFGTNLGVDYVLGEFGGAESVSLNLTNLPSHNHTFAGTASAANVKQPQTGAALAQSSSGNAFYAQAGSPTVTAINPGTVGTTGGGLPHSNIQPYLTINWCIALAGVFPARN